MDWVLPIINEQACIVCGDCAAVCPTDALSAYQGRIVFLAPQNCTYCTLCEQICPQHAIRCEFAIVMGLEEKWNE